MCRINRGDKNRHPWPEFPPSLQRGPQTYRIASARPFIHLPWQFLRFSRHKTTLGRHQIQHCQGVWLRNLLFWRLSKRKPSKTSLLCYDSLESSRSLSGVFSAARVFEQPRRNLRSHFSFKCSYVFAKVRVPRVKGFARGCTQYECSPERTHWFLFAAAASRIAYVSWSAPNSK